MTIEMTTRQSSVAKAAGLLSARPFDFETGAPNISLGGAAQLYYNEGFVKKEVLSDGRLKTSFRADWYNGLTSVQKSQVNLAALAAGNGLLEPAHRDRFLNLAEEEAIVLKIARRIPMGNFEYKLNRMEMGSRILRNTGPEGKIPEAQRATINFLASVLRAQSFRGCVSITWASMKDSITRSPEVFQEQTLSQMAMGVGRDMEQNLNEGDVNSIDNDLKAFDGLIKNTQTNIVPSIGTTITTADLAAMDTAMPDRFAGGDIRWIMGRQTNIQLNTFIRGRSTARGDVEVDGRSTGPIMGYDRVAAMRWPYDLGGGNNETAVVQIAPANIVVGVWDELEFMVDQDIDGAAVKIYVSIRWTSVVEEPRASTQLQGLLDPKL